MPPVCRQNSIPNLWRPESPLVCNHVKNELAASQATPIKRPRPVFCSRKLTGSFTRNRESTNIKTYAAGLHPIRLVFGCVAPSRTGEHLVLTFVIDSSKSTHACPNPISRSCALSGFITDHFRSATIMERLLNCEKNAVKATWFSPNLTVQGAITCTRKLAATATQILILPSCRTGSSFDAFCPWSRLWVNNQDLCKEIGLLQKSGVSVAQVTGTTGAPIAITHKSLNRWPARWQPDAPTDQGRMQERAFHNDEQAETGPPPAAARTQIAISRPNSTTISGGSRK